MGVQQFFVNEKAIIEILDLREIGEVSKETLPVSDGGVKGGSTLTAGAAAKLQSTTASAFTSGGSSIASDSLSQLQNALTYSAGEGRVTRPSLKNLTMKGVKKTFEVQFNPSDIEIEGMGGGRVATTAYNVADDKDRKSAGGISYGPAPVRINFSVKLLFDKMDANESFLSAKTNLAPSELAKSGASLAKTGVQMAAGKLGKNIGEQSFSVQQEVEALMAALRSPYTRTISFYWGDMVYCGVLNRVSAQYVMFNSAGEPVRAYVQLSLICADKEVSPSSLGAWEHAYNDAFGSGDQTLVGMTQRVGSLFNISK